MPRGERDYAQSKIYRLTHGAKTIYIGSSVMPLHKRMTKHRSAARGGKTSNIYTYMREVGLENVRIVLLEAWPCQSKEELIQREQYWLEHATDSFPNVDLKNTLRAHCTVENRRMDNVTHNRRYIQTEKGQAAVARKRKPYVCRCGRTVSFTCRFRHVSTKVHTDALKKRAAKFVAIMFLAAIVCEVQNSTVQNSGE